MAVDFAKIRACAVGLGSLLFVAVALCAAGCSSGGDTQQARRRPSASTTTTATPIAPPTTVTAAGRRAPRATQSECGPCPANERPRARRRPPPAYRGPDTDGAHHHPADRPRPPDLRGPRPRHHRLRPVALARYRDAGPGRQHGLPRAPRHAQPARSSTSTSSRSATASRSNTTTAASPTKSPKRWSSTTATRGSRVRPTRRRSRSSVVIRSTRPSSATS